MCGTCLTSTISIAQTPRYFSIRQLSVVGSCKHDMLKLVFLPAEEGKGKAEDLKRHREHLAAALHALQTLLEAQPRLSAIMASTAALAPFCNCIEPICRRTLLCFIMLLGF